MSSMLVEVLAIWTVADVAHHRFGGCATGKLALFLRERFDLC